VIEWLFPPVLYTGDLRFREEALELTRRVAHPQAIGRHYLHLAERQTRAYLPTIGSVPFKKLCSTLRPALARRWQLLHLGAAVAPIHFPTLATHRDLPRQVVTVIDELLRR
jgi:uncharacterized protein